MVFLEGLPDFTALTTLTCLLSLFSITSSCVSGAWLAGQTAPSSQAVIAAKRRVQCAAFPARGRGYGFANLWPVGHPKCVWHCTRKRPTAVPWQQPSYHHKQQPTPWWEAWASGQGRGSACQEVNKTPTQPTCLHLHQKIKIQYPSHYSSLFNFCIQCNQYKTIFSYFKFFWKKTFMLTKSEM